jgi:hypothetical protein
MDMAGQSKMPPNDYTRQWRRYKTFKKLRFFALLGWIPLIAVYILIYRPSDLQAFRASLPGSLSSDDVRRGDPAGSMALPKVRQVFLGPMTVRF